MSETVGIIGAGTIADAYYIPTLKLLGFSALYITDSNQQTASAVAHKHSITSVTIDALIQVCSTIIIATPPHTHFELLIRCIQAKGKTILCEKPFLFSKSEAEEVVRLSNKCSATVLVAHLRRCFTAIEHAQQLIPNLSLGRLQKATLWEGGRFSYKPKSDYTTENKYGGVLLDTGSHVIDCFLFVTGLSNAQLTCDVLSVQKDKAEPSHEVSYQFLLNDIRVSLKLSRYKALANKMVLYFENGIVEIPLGLKPNIVVTVQGIRKTYSSQDACLNYMSEAFKRELHLMFVQKDQTLFNAQSFVQLSGILETLYKA
jgi:predicted dehydrogenase